MEVVLKTTQPACATQDSNLLFDTSHNSRRCLVHVDLDSKKLVILHEGEYGNKKPVGLLWLFNSPERAHPSSFSDETCRRVLAAQGNLAVVAVSNPVLTPRVELLRLEGSAIETVLPLKGGKDYSG